MSESVSVPLTPGQVLVFQQLTRQEREAEQIIATVNAARNAAAMAVVLATHSVESVQGQALTIGDTAITFTPTEPT